MRQPYLLLLLLTLPLAPAFAQPGGTLAAPRPAPKTRVIEVEPGVQIETLDWGGEGRALIFIPGGGQDAHEFDAFAPNFTRNHHVYAISRRGSGRSSAPKPDGTNYSSDRLGDDVLAVIANLRLDRPMLAGHSLGGVELSSVGSRFPSKVAGLIYLDAAYSYAFYVPALGDPIFDVVDLNRLLGESFTRTLGDATLVTAIKTASSRVAQDMDELEAQRALMPPQPPRPANAPPPPAIPLALALERTRYTTLHVPALAIYADPHSYGGLYRDAPAKLAAVIENDRKSTSAQADALAAGVPGSHVVRIPNAGHDIFRTNEEQVTREMNDFMNGLAP